VSKIAKPAVSFVMSVSLSVRPSLYPHGTTHIPLNGFS